MTDRATLEELRERVDRIEAETAALRDLGDRENLPAVERTATRLSGVLEQLARNLPPELVDD